MMNYTSIVTILLLLLSGQNVNSQESPPEPTPVIPIAIEQGYLEGRGLTRLDPSELDGENVTRDEDFTSESYTHAFYAGKIFVAVYEAGPGRVYIDGAVYDEFIQILEGRLILTPDGGDAIEFKQGESLVVRQGYKGYWYMPEKYRELIIINTDYAQTEGGS
ncbi:cupin domain-containing protein [Luminiphilus sp.]|nr:cupin domain-containing protein [Luminiphilus sp.]MDA8985863.1 cupin domain-containing protein [Luminiphilus sp.]